MAFVAADKDEIDNSSDGDSKNAESGHASCLKKKNSGDYVHGPVRFHRNVLWRTIGDWAGNTSGDFFDRKGPICYEESPAPLHAE